MTIPDPAGRPVEPDTDTGEYPPPFAQWSPPSSPVRGWMSVWALVAGIVALAASLFVGWAFPIALVAIVVAILALRRPIERRVPALWAIVLGSAALAFSAGWLIYATMVVNATV